MVTAKKPTKKLQPVTSEELYHEDSKEIEQKLNQVLEYMERIDWKLWVMMNIVKWVAEENGYKFDYSNNTSASTTNVDSIEKEI